MRGWEGIKSKMKVTNSTLNQGRKEEETSRDGGTAIRAEGTWPIVSIRDGVSFCSMFDAGVVCDLMSEVAFCGMLL